MLQTHYHDQLPSADLDNALAMYQLGKLYLSGEGVVGDEEKALGYFISAADHDNAFAAFKAYCCKAFS